VNLMSNLTDRQLGSVYLKIENAFFDKSTLPNSYICRSQKLLLFFIVRQTIGMEHTSALYKFQSSAIITFKVTQYRGQTIVRT
jgi:hypothetical protein